MPGLTYWDASGKPPLKMNSRTWEAEAVDYAPVEIEKLSRKDLLQFAVDARQFIMRTMTQMELRPKRSYLRRLKRGKHGR